MDKPKADHRLLNLIRSTCTLYVFAALLIIYFLIIIFFGYIYNCHPKDISIKTSDESSDNKGVLENKSQQSFLDYIYFSFVTAATIGYGDYYPITEVGKNIVVIQSIICSIYFAGATSIVTSKLLWTSSDTIRFSKKILYNPQEKSFQVRIINTNSMPIINPEIRMTMTEHKVGDIIAGALELDNRAARPIYLGRHDFILDIGKYGVNPENPFEHQMIMFHLKKAILYQNKVKKNDSRFRITITVSGSNGIQNIAEIKKYYATDFVEGDGFEVIKYGENDTNKFGMKYRRISAFWTNFDGIKNEKKLRL